MNTPTHLGARAEQLALKFLRKRHLKFIIRNYRCCHGEIDLIMREQDTLVFIEVRYRKANNFASGIETINARKKIHLTRTAWHFLQHNRSFLNHPCRFDVIGINQQLNITWIKNAFEVQY